MAEAKFSWPGGRKVALSLSFDDSRPSQVERGVPVLNRFGAKGTFYVCRPSLESKLEQWRAAAAVGHEIGNHSVTHPCSGNFVFSRGNALESYTLERMEGELLGATAFIQELLGITPTTFAYPCGQKFVGAGPETRSYVPLVAKHFVVGRGFRDEYHNTPWACDMAQVFGVDFDGADFATIRGWLDRATAESGWLCLAGHDVGPGGRTQMVSEETLAEICRYCQDPANGVWLDTVAAVGAHIQKTRRSGPVASGVR